MILEFPGIFHRKTTVGDWGRRVARKIRRVLGWCHWRVRTFPAIDRRIVHIFGAQRSGTGALSNSFERDLRATVFREDSQITGLGSNRLRLRPLEDLESIFCDTLTPLIVTKPLVESQRANELLDRFSASGIWMIRSYQDVVASNLKRFSRQIENVGKLVENCGSDWRSENVSDDTRQFAARHFAPDMDRANAAALMWYARNVLFFEQHLENRPDVFVCRYEDLVCNPGFVMRKIYSFIRSPFPGEHITVEFDTASIGLSKTLDLHPAIERRCRELEAELDRQCAA